MNGGWGEREKACKSNPDIPQDGVQQGKKEGISTTYGGYNGAQKTMHGQSKARGPRTTIDHPTFSPCHEKFRNGKGVKTHLAVHRKVDRRVNLLDTHATRHACPVGGWQRPRGHKFRCEAEGLETL
jgi:hypothetical protein